MDFSVTKTFRDKLGRYRIHYHSETGVWRIYDLHDEDLDQYSDLEADIPDDSSAVTILSEGAVEALLEEMQRIGFLGRVTKDLRGNIDEEKTCGCEDLKEKVKELEDRLHKEKGERQYSEDYMTKQDIIGALLKISTLKTLEGIK